MYALKITCILKVKVAKKIQKDMEKWAKTLNQKKEHKPTAASTAVDTSHSATSEPVSMSLNSGTSGKSSGTADAGYFILEGRMVGNISSLLLVQYRN